MPLPVDLLLTILNNPNDDVPRLIASDWLDDQGEAERAEFVRVQCELAKIPSEPTKHRHNCKPPRGSVLCHRCEWLLLHGGKESLLRRRELELLDARSLLWLDESFGGIPWCGKSEIGDSFLMPFGPDGDSRIEVRFRRGFVESVSCRLVDWTQHGPAIVACQPVTRVVLTDKQPYSTNGVYCWLAADLHGDEHLPTFLIDILQSLTGTVAASRAIALDAISVACIQWAKAAKKGEDNG